MENLLEVKNLQFSFRTYGGVVKAVRDVSFEVRPGEILGIVGESGCGKSVTSQCLMRLNPEPPGFFEGGEILYKGKDVLKMNKKELRQFRGKEISYIFQDPMTSLNPTMRIGKQIEEVFVGRKGMSAAEKKAKALEILKMVGISDGERRYKQYPHELSGGMRQRVVIAMSLSCNPKMIIADEPTTALDVTIQAQVLDLLRDLKDKIDASILLITHDLGVVAEMADYVVVIDGGEISAKGTPVELKEKYAGDILIISPKKNNTGAKEYLQNNKLAFAEVGADIKINIKSTMDSLPILDACRDYIDGFEVLNGTLDDAFIAITGKEIRE